MNPDLVKAIPEITRSGILSEEKAALLLRVARGELVSVDPEIRLLFYFGVLLTAAGAGILVKDNYQQIGPLAVACFIGLGALISFGVAVRKAPAFSWNEVESPSVGFDYLLLLGVLLAVSDLVFIEIQFTSLGTHWPWHLLIASLLMAWVAVRYDSRTIFSLSLSTFAAWRGVSVSLLEKSFWGGIEESIRWNSLACGVFFILLGRFLLKSGKKSHFEPIAVHIGWLLVFGGLISGCTQDGAQGILYITVLALAGAGLAWLNVRRKRFTLFLFGSAGIFVALAGLVLKSSLAFEGKALLISMISLLLMFLLWRIHRSMKEPL